MLEIIKKSNIYIEKNSKFVGIIVKCEKANKVKGFVQRIKKMKEFTKANCYIYGYKINGVLGKNDGGEPGSGRIILGQLQHTILNNILIIVMRWYGGKHIGSKRFKIIGDISKELIEFHESSGY